MWTVVLSKWNMQKLTVFTTVIITCLMFLLSPTTFNPNQSILFYDSAATSNVSLIMRVAWWILQGFFYSFKIAAPNTPKLNSVALGLKRLGHPDLNEQKREELISKTLITNFEGVSTRLCFVSIGILNKFLKLVFESFNLFSYHLI